MIINILLPLQYYNNIATFALRVTPRFWRNTKLCYDAGPQLISAILSLRLLHKNSSKCIIIYLPQACCLLHPSFIGSLCETHQNKTT